MDGLWDILVSNKYIPGEYEKTVKTYAAIYMKKAYKHAAKDNKIAKIVYTKKSSRKDMNTIIFNEFQSLNQIIVVNEYNMLVDSQLKEDRTYDTMPLNKNNQMNILIRKKEAHSDLA